MENSNTKHQVEYCKLGHSIRKSISWVFRRTVAFAKIGQRKTDIPANRRRNPVKRTQLASVVAIIIKTP